MEDKEILDVFKPRAVPLYEILEKDIESAEERRRYINEDIIPKEDDCSNCPYHTKRIREYISPWNDEVTRREEEGYCRVYEEWLVGSKESGLDFKCLHCLLHTNEDFKAKAFILILSMLKNEK